ncbi:hypothetical protein OAL13_00025 [bacterium]|nr:hypothetical protein [bacterium]
MTWAITTLKDYQAMQQKPTSFKAAAVNIFSKDIALALNAEVEIIPTIQFGREPELRPDLSKYEGIVLAEHPFQASPVLSFPNPPTDATFRQMRSILDYEGPIKTWNFWHSYPNWRAGHARAMSAGSRAQTWHNDQTEAELLRVIMSETIDDLVASAKQTRTHHVIGDSHAYSAWEPNASIYGLQGKTLFSALKIGLTELTPGTPEKITFNLGNTDLRHHLARQPDPLQATTELAEEYVRQVSQIDAEVVVYGLLPNIEDDSKFYKSYRYKNELHAGPIELRDELRTRFNEVVSAGVSTFRSTPKCFINDAGHLIKQFHEARGPHVHAKAMAWNFLTNEYNDVFSWY